MPESASEKAAHRIAAQIATEWVGIGPLRIVVDGPSGSGKTTFAKQLARCLSAYSPDPEEGLQTEPKAQMSPQACRMTNSASPILVLNSDDWVLGWEGYSAATRVTEELLTGKRACYPHFDWVRYEVAEEACPDPALTWIVEGSGSLTRTSAEAADFTVWVEAPEEEAKARALARDGDDFAPWWDTWKAQENHHMLTHQPKSLADYVVATG